MLKKTKKHVVVITSMTNHIDSIVRIAFSAYLRTLVIRGSHRDGCFKLT